MRGNIIEEWICVRVCKRGRERLHCIDINTEVVFACDSRSVLWFAMNGSGYVVDGGFGGVGV